MHACMHRSAHRFRKARRREEMAAGMTIRLRMPPMRITSRCVSSIVMVLCVLD